MTTATLIALGVFDEPDFGAVNAIAAKVRVNTASWTGIEERVAADPRIIGQLKGKVCEAKSLVDLTNLTNSERAKTIAILNGIDALLDSPEPAWKEIIGLFSSPVLNNLMGFLNILLFVFQSLNIH